MIIDEIIPKYDFTEVHSLTICCDAAEAYRAVREVSLQDISNVVRLLFFLRALPERMAGHPFSTLAADQPMLSEMLSNGFVLLAEHTSQELVFGLLVPSHIGRFWRKDSRLDPKVKDARQFLAFRQTGYLRVVGNISVESGVRAGQCSIRTESRTQAFCPADRRSFLPYWRVIRPFSGLIRRMWLRGIRKRAIRNKINGKVVE